MKKIKKKKIITEETGITQSETRSTVNDLNNYEITKKKQGHQTEKRNRDNREKDNIKGNRNKKEQIEARNREM